jgi:hypothetical protein
MEKNTVILSVEDYNDLRDFKAEILKGSILSSNGYSSTKFTTTTKDVVIERLSADNLVLNDHKKNDQKTIGSLKDQIHLYKEKFGDLEDTKLTNNQKEFNDKIKELTLWEFIKLKLK